MGEVNKKLNGKVALVTGGARAIGRAHALRLAVLGVDVVINDINLESFKEYGEEISAPTVMDEVRKLGARSMGIAADVGKKDQVEEMVKKVLAEFGRIDILVNNAGGIAGQIIKSFASFVSEEDLRATFDRNLMGTIYCSQAVAPFMKKQNWGRIINTASQAGLQAQQGGIYASYGAAKAGVMAYTRYLAQELGPFGVTVNCLVPAYVLTERLEAIAYKARPGSKEETIARIPLGRLAEPDDVAKVMEFFVSDLADYVTGQCLTICGGAIRF